MSTLVELSPAEIDSSAVIIVEKGLQTTLAGSIQLCRRMHRIDSTFRGRPVGCYYIPEPQKVYVNKYASAVMGQQITGNAVLVSSEGVDVKEVYDAPRSFAGLAAQLPKAVPITEEEKQRRQREKVEQEQRWREERAERRYDEAARRRAQITGHWEEEVVEEDDVDPFADASLPAVPDTQ